MISISSYKRQIIEGLFLKALSSLWTIFITYEHTEVRLSRSTAFSSRSYVQMGPKLTLSWVVSKVKTGCMFCCLSRVERKKATMYVISEGIATLRYILRHNVWLNTYLLLKINCIISKWQGHLICNGSQRSPRSSEFYSQIQPSGQDKCWHRRCLQTTGMLKLPLCL